MCVCLLCVCLCVVCVCVGVYVVCVCMRVFLLDNYIGMLSRTTDVTSRHCHARERE